MDHTRYGLWIFIILQCLLVPAITEMILFESGNSLKTVDDPSVYLDDVSLVADPKNSGAKLFDSTGVDATTLSLNIRPRDFRTQSAILFRAHPDFIKCLQKIISKFRNLDPSIKLVIASGYKTTADVGTSTKVQDLYARSGTGAELRYHYEHIGADILDIAEAALKLCPVIFEKIQRDIGVVMLSGGVHIHMTGTADSSPLFDVDGYGGMVSGAFKTWALGKLSDGLDPAKTPDCSRFTAVTNGATYPPGATSPESIVGDLDMPITRNDVEDFKKLVQYLGTNIDFEDSEGSAAWCGSDGVACNPCQAEIAGSALSKRCADRVMSARMYNVIRKLQKAVRDTFAGNKLKILEAWDEPYEGHPTGDNPADSLHFEGRAVQLQLASSNSDANLQTVSQFAKCFGVDYVKHEGDKLLLAVKKMKGYEEQTVKFPSSIELVAVEPPFSKMDLYQLPDEFSSEEDQYPIFDTSHRGDVILADGATISKFASTDSEFRYMRIHPRIVQCYSDIVYQENKWKEPGDTLVDVDVQFGFLANPEQDSLFDRFLDPRFNKLTLGTSLQVGYAPGSPEDRTIYTLVESVIDKCAPLFHKDEQKLFLRIGYEGVFLDMSDEFEVEMEHEDLLPDGKDIDTLHAELNLRSIQAIEGRLVDPDDKDEACNLSQRPVPQDISFKYSHPEIVQRRRKRAAPDEQECVPQRDTAFCTSTKKHREAEVDYIWKEIMLKWRYHDETELKDALIGCIDNCGTCMDGDIWEDKMEHCSNFLHWANFDLMNEAPDISNFYSKNNLLTRRFACENGQHCIDRSPLFAQLAPSINRIYRPDPLKSNKEELYSSEDNPLPMTQLLDQLYGINARGKVKYYVIDETEMTSMKAALQVPMQFNRNVTSIEIYVVNEISLEAVDSVVQNFAKEWSTTGCPEHTRVALTPFEVLNVPHHLQKRSADPPDVSEQMLYDRLHYNERWLREDL